MPITTRSSARHDADVADMYSLLLSSLKDAISEGVHQDGQFVEASSDDESDEESPVELPSLRAGGSAPGAVLATPVSNEDGGKGEGQRSNISSESTESPKNEDAWPLAAWEHQVSMPKPAVSGVPREASPHWATQKAQPAANAHAPIQDARKATKLSRKVKDDTAGPGWFEMKAQPITDEVKRDWRLLRLRAAYDPKKFYKTFDSTKIPKHFQRGTIIEGTGEFYSARLTKRERKQTLAEELAADIKLKQERKRRYTRMQEEKQELAKKRKKARALHKRSKHRPKH